MLEWLSSCHHVSPVTGFLSGLGIVIRTATQLCRPVLN